MNDFIGIIKKIRLTPILIYSLMLIIDNLFSMPFISGVNQGAIGNVISLLIIILSVIVLVIERFISFGSYNKNLCIIEFVFIAITTFFYWCIFYSLPLPTMNRLIMN